MTRNSSIPSLLVVSVWISLASVRAQQGQREAALAAVARVTALDASRRLEMVDDELLAGVC